MAKRATDHTKPGSISNLFSFLFSESIYLEEDTCSIQSSNCDLVEIVISSHPSNSHDLPWYNNDNFTWSPDHRDETGRRICAQPAIKISFDKIENDYFEPPPSDLVLSQDILDFYSRTKPIPSNCVFSSATSFVRFNAHDKLVRNANLSSGDYQ